MAKIPQHLVSTLVGPGITTDIQAAVGTEFRNPRLLLSSSHFNVTNDPTNKQTIVTVNTVNLASGSSLELNDYLQVGPGPNFASTGSIRGDKWFDIYVIDSGGTDVNLLDWSASSGALTLYDNTVQIGSGFVSSSYISSSHAVFGDTTADSGAVRLPNDNSINWRNAGNSANLGIKLNTSDQIEFDAPILTSTGGLLKSNAHIGWTALQSVFSGTVDVSATSAATRRAVYGDAGSKMFVLDDSATATVHQYDLSVAYDISSAALSGSFSVQTQASAPYDVKFATDGTKMYVIDVSTVTVYEYDLGTAWTVGTAAYNGQSFNVTSQQANPRGIFFKDDGLEWFLCGLSPDSVHHYSSSVAWAVASSSYTGDSVSVAHETTSPVSVEFRGDGLQMYVFSQTPKDLLVYDTDGPYSLSGSNSAASGSLSLAGRATTTAYGVAFDPTGQYALAVTAGKVHCFNTHRLIRNN